MDGDVLLARIGSDELARGLAEAPDFPDTFHVAFHRLGPDGGLTGLEPRVLQLWSGVHLSALFRQLFVDDLPRLCVRDLEDLSRIGDGVP